MGDGSDHAASEDSKMMRKLLLAILCMVLITEYSGGKIDGSQVGGPTSVAPAQDEDTGERLIRSAAEKEEEDKTKKKSEKRKGKKRKAVAKKRKSVDKKTQKKGKRQRLGNQERKKNRMKLKGR